MATAVKTFSATVRGTDPLRVTCGLCGAASFRPELVSASFTFVRCDGCGVTYQNPQPSPRSVRERYGAEYFSYEIENEANFHRLMQLGLRDIGFERLPGVRERGAFLDVGCATGMLLEGMREQGWSTQGVEICVESAAFAARKRGLDVFVGDLEEAGFPGASFRVVHFSHLIEHLPQPRRFVAEVRRIVAPGGWVVVTTPNRAGLQARLLGTRWRSAIADHLYLFRPATLRMLLESTGFRVVRTVTWGGIAKGLAPAAVKVPLDRLAKLLGFGDVMLFLATPTG